MTALKIAAVAVAAMLLVGCKYETFADPQLSGRDLELMKLAPPMPPVDPMRARYRVTNPTGEKQPGTIVVESNAKFLYLIEEGGTALRYPIAVGQDHYQWIGEAKVGRKAEWPSWTPPAEMRERRPDLPRFMTGGPDNPMGARAMYLGSSLYRIHGTNEPNTIGQAVSSGCIRMTNDDVTDLYERVRVGAKVLVI